MKRLLKYKTFETYKLTSDPTVCNVTGQNLTSLYELPTGLERLHCSGNKLKYLPELPKTLKQLSCSDNNLTSLPELPAGLKMLYCHSNVLTSLPELPDGLINLVCHINNIKFLPKLPEGLEYLACVDNPLECLIPKKFLNDHTGEWLEYYYKPFISSYEGQKKILFDDSGNLIESKVAELVEQTKIHPRIIEEYPHYLFAGVDLNLL